MEVSGKGVDWVETISRFDQYDAAMLAMRIAERSGSHSGS
jgi:hypothetical protein